MFDGTSEQSSSSKADGNDIYSEKLREIDALIVAFPSSGERSDDDDESATKTPPESALGTALNNMVSQWNSLLSQVVTEVDNHQPIMEHIKETAEFSVKQFRDACLEMNSELTRVSLDWQLKSPEEMAKQEIAEYESSIRRQEQLLARMKQKLDDEIACAENLNF